MGRMLYMIKLSAFYAVVTLIMALNKMLIRILSFKRLVAYYSNKNEICDTYTINYGRVRLIHHVVNKLSKKLFWKPMCYEQSLTVMFLARLFKMPTVVFFGIKKDPVEGMLAHAWSQIGEYYITGYENMQDFTMVYKMSYAPKIIP